MTTASVRKLFAELKRELKPMVRAIAEQTPVDDSCLRGAFDEAAQLDFGLSLAKQIGYDLTRGRLDQTHHPFCTKFSIGDVRITTRVYDNDISLALFATLHETGHALYEQGINSALEGTPLGTGTSSGVHESQSRLWENVVARSRGFWGHYYPLLQKAFPDQFGRVPLETFYRAINKVAPSLIRGDADEVTYNLHVMLRFELELQLLEGRLGSRTCRRPGTKRCVPISGWFRPTTATAACRTCTGSPAASAAAFQGYTIGNILSSQFYAAAVKAHPEIPREIGNGKLGTLHDWLRGQIYRHGRKYTPDEIVERAAGEPMSMQPYLAYLRTKYGEIYRCRRRKSVTPARSPVGRPSPRTPIRAGWRA